MQDEDANLVKYSKHIPRLLRQQILCGLMNKYVPASTPKNSPKNSFSFDGAVAQPPEKPPLVANGPSMQRFHGALLFVDISGFTALSQKLEIEALKNHINSYFSKMLDIVEKWEGDVVKFAGDALYIVWPTSIQEQHSTDDASSIVSSTTSASVSHSAEFALAAKKALEQAVACGLQISAVCGNYEVRLTAATENTSLLGRLGGMMTFGGIMGGKVVPTNGDGSSEDIVYLNVHSGVSCGLMAGVDIVHSNRAEFFLVGDPLTGVAMAESQASKGDVVLDTSAHELMHGENAGQAVKGHLGETPSESPILAHAATKKDSVRAAEHSLLCGCSRTEDGMFLVSKLLLGGGGRRKTRNSATAGTSTTPSSPARGSVVADQNNKIADEIENELEKLFLSTKSSIKKEFYAFLHTLQELTEDQEFNADCEGFGKEIDKKIEEKKFSMFLKDILKKHFMEWMTCALVDSVIHHVHDVARHTSGTSRKKLSTFHDVLRNSTTLLASASSATEPIINYRLSADAPGSDSKLFLPPIITDELNSPAAFKERHKRTPTNTSPNAEITNGELRTVIVMFIKIERFDLRLKIDTKGKAISFSYNRFSFLDRTPNEQQADNFLLNRFQACYEVLCSALMNNGGQLRQFIVDDKGTVCIGTFGLRGSAAMDNAAAALEAAKQIIDGLRKIDLKASIGITSGKAYCGLVGSFMRHEYAVMGPSTNLSARLMCKAPPHGAICDADTVSRDRTHKFAFVSEVQAKGYTKPVMTYNPVFVDENEDVEDSGRKLVSKSGNSGVPMKSTRIISRASLRNAAKEVSDVMTTANLASQNKLSTQQKMLALVKTDFFISEATAMFDSAGNQKTSMSQKLHGRDEEITEILTFLFDDDADNPQLISASGKTKMITVCGSTGTGKTALLNAVERKLQNVVRTDHTCNMVILRNRTTSLQHDLPFRSWQVLLHKLFLAVYNQVDGGHGVSATRQAGGDNFSKLSNFGTVIDVIWPQLPEEFQAKKDLLSVLSLTQSTDLWQQAKPEDKTEDKLEACAALMAALVTAISKILKKFVLLIMVEVQNLDKWSLVTLHKVWATSVGVGIIAGFDTTETLHIDQFAASSGKDSGMVDNVSKFFKKYLADHDHFQMIFLKALGKEATIAMVSQMCSDLTTAELEKIYETSAGKPMYVSELVGTLSKSTSFKFNTVKVDGHALAEAMPSGNVSHRIEEVICYRLDKLHLSCQVVLKATAVAVSYGRTCTLGLLKFVLSDNAMFGANIATPGPLDEGYDLHNDEEDDPMDNPHSVRLALLELLLNEDFLIIKSGAAMSSTELTSTMLSDAEFEFNIPLEQSTIYGLIVDVQKEFFHERIALYMHHELRKAALSDVKLRDVWEKGFHWDRAGYWSRSMGAYLLAAKKCKAEGNSLRCTESFLMAYQIYQNMEQEVAIIALPEQCYGFADQIARCLFMPSMENMNELETSADLILALKTAQEVFEPDPASIVDAIELHIMLAEIYLYKWEDFQEIMRILSVGVLLGAASVWKAPQDGQKSSQLNNRKGTKASNDDSHFVVSRPELSKIDYLQLFSLYCYTARLVSLEMPFATPVEFTKAMFASDAPELLDGTLLAVHSETMTALRFLHMGKASKARLFLDEVLKVYDPSSHSAALAARYSADFLPYALALLSQAQIAGKDAKTGMDYWQKALTCLQSVSHDYSLTIALMALMSSVHFLGEYNAIAKLLEKSQELVQQGYNTMGSQMCKLMQLWMEVSIISPKTIQMSSADSIATSLSETGMKLIDDFLELSKALDGMMTATSNVGSTVVMPSAMSVAVAAISSARSQSSAPINYDVTMGKLTFMELHGCAVERIYVEIMCGLWHVANEGHLYVLEQRIQNSLQILLQCPVHDFMSVISKGYNMLHSLTHVLLTGKSANGLSAGAIYTAVTERAEQPLLMLLKLLQQKDCPYISWLLAACIKILPLHDSIKDAYIEVHKDTEEKVKTLNGDEKSLQAAKQLARKVRVPVS